MASQYGQDMRDPYQVLNVDRQATEAQIKSAFRKLAKQHHPDRHPGDKKAEEKFKEINAAYGIIGDAEQRKRFDRGEIDASGNEQMAGFGGGGFGGGGFGRGGGGFRDGGGFGGGRGGFRSTQVEIDPEDLFADFFGGMGGGRQRPRTGPEKGADRAYMLAVDFKTAALGGSEQLELASGKKLNIKIPAGATEGQQIRLKGQGDPGPFGGPAGDALVTLSIRPHPWFTRDGSDLRLDLPVTLSEAVLGAKVTAPTLEGSVALTVHPGSNSGTKLRLKGKGAANPGGGHGDLYVTLQVVLPEDNPDLRKLAEKLAKSDYDVRARFDRK